MSRSTARHTVSRCTPVFVNALFLALTCLPLGACGDALPDATAPQLPVSLSIAPARTRLGVGQQSSLSALVTPASSADALKGKLEWTSSDPTIVAVAPYGPNFSTTMTARRAGDATITASVPGGQATVSVSVSELPPSIGQLVVEDFKILQFQYPSAPGRWDYAPFVRVREASGKGAAYVVAVSFDVPGSTDVGTIDWPREVVAGSRDDLFQILYGDSDVTLGSSTVPLVGTTATVRIATTDSLGARVILSASGPVVSSYP